MISEIGKRRFSVGKHYFFRRNNKGRIWIGKHKLCMRWPIKEYS